MMCETLTVRTPQDPQPKKLLSTGKAAQAIGVSSTALWNWWKSGKVHPVLVTAGGQARWDLAKLEQQLEALADKEDQMEEADPQPTVVAAVVTSTHGVLVARRRDGKPPWTLIAGEMHPGETPPQTAEREVREETGLVVQAGDKIGDRVHPATGRQMIYLAAYPVDPDQEPQLLDDYELSEVRWAQLGEAVELLPGLFQPVLEHLRQQLS